MVRLVDGDTAAQELCLPRWTMDRLCAVERGAVAGEIALRYADKAGGCGRGDSEHGLKRTRRKIKKLRKIDPEPSDKIVLLPKHAINPEEVIDAKFGGYWDASLGLNLSLKDEHRQTCTRIDRAIDDLFVEETKRYAAELGKKLERGYEERGGVAERDVLVNGCWRSDKNLSGRNDRTIA